MLVGHHHALGQDVPPVVGTIGLHGSASTWIFNVVRELLVSVVGDDKVLPAYVESVDDIPSADDRDGKCLVFKSHHGSAGLDEWIAATRSLIFLSVRDPRDATISMVQRFNTPLKETAHGMAKDCARLARLADEGYLLLRYEQRFFDRRNAVELIAGRLRIPCPAAVIDDVFANHTTEAVRAFARSVAALPSDRLVVTGSTMVDRVTQIHRTHIGDTQIGKWRQMAAPDQAALTQFFQPFLEKFGYALS
jgi:hypothetical protein